MTCSPKTVSVASILLLICGAQAMVITRHGAATNSTATTHLPFISTGVPVVEAQGGFRPMCQQNYFTCLNSQCVPVLQACDGKPDCSDRSDEVNCENLPTTTLGQQLVEIFAKYRNCNENIQMCAKTQGVKSGTNSSEVCDAYARATMCILYDSCNFSDEDRKHARNIIAIIVERESGCTLGDLDQVLVGNLTVEPTPRPKCVTSCDGLANGDYQSCQGCDRYASCVDGTVYDNRLCPSNLVWDDVLKRCDWKSDTC